MKKKAFMSSSGGEFSAVGRWGDGRWRSLGRTETQSKSKRSDKGKKPRPGPRRLGERGEKRRIKRKRRQANPLEPKAGEMCPFPLEGGESLELMLGKGRLGELGVA